MFQPICGLLVLLVLCVGFSENRKKIDWQRIAMAAILQVVLALFLLKTQMGKDFFFKIGDMFGAVVQAYGGAMEFMLGDKPAPGQSSSPFQVMRFSFLLSILPMIIFVSSLASVLYHYRILQVFIRFFATLFQKMSGMSGPEALAASANIFLGMAEAPTVIAPYIKKLTRAQIFMVMVGGMATISGALLFLCSLLLQNLFSGGQPEAAAHLLTASVISAPAAFLIARLLVPEEVFQQQEAVLEAPKTTGFFDALSEGAIMGLKLTAYVAAMLIAVVSLVKLIDITLVAFFGEAVSLGGILGIFMEPVAWLIGVKPEFCAQAGELLGIKVVVNEVVAYEQMGQMTWDDTRSSTILSYAMCGFANLGSIGIMIASMSGLCPDRRSEIAGLGFKAMWGGFMAICLTAIVVAFLV